MMLHDARSESRRERTELRTEEQTTGWLRRLPGRAAPCVRPAAREAAATQQRTGRGELFQRKRSSLTETDPQRALSRTDCTGCLTPAARRPYLCELLEDPVTLVGADGHLWEEDRDGRVIQHLQLILNPGESDRCQTDRTSKSIQ